MNSLQRKEEIFQKYSHDNVLSTFQSSKQVLDRKAKLRLLKQIAQLEHQLLRKNDESDTIRAEIQELKVGDVSESDTSVTPWLRFMAGHRRQRPTTTTSILHKL